MSTNAAGVDIHLHFTVYLITYAPLSHDGLLLQVEDFLTTLLLLLSPKVRKQPRSLVRSGNPGRRQRLSLPCLFPWLRVWRHPSLLQLKGRRFLQNMTFNFHGRLSDKPFEIPPRILAMTNMVKLEEKTHSR